MQTIELNNSIVSPLFRAIPLLTVAYRTEIILGNPKAKCARMGICIVNEVQFFNGETRPNNQAYAMMQCEGDFLKINFLRSSMNEFTYEKHFGTGVFLLEQAANFSLGEKEIIISSGVYHYKQNKQYIALLLPIS